MEQPGQLEAPQPHGVPAAELPDDSLAGLGPPLPAQAGTDQAAAAQAQATDSADASFVALRFSPLGQPFLMRLRRHLDQERQRWNLMLLAAALCGMGGLTLFLMSMIVASFLVLPVMIGLAVLLIYLSQQNYQRHYREVRRDLLEGPMLLLLLDESFGRNIEEQRRQRYRPVYNQVPLGESLMERVNYCAHYYKHYWRASRGMLEQPIPGMTQLGCLQDGLFAALSGCSAGCLLALPFYVLALFRLLEVWPRVLAVKQALLDILDGRCEAELEALYAGRRLPAADPGSQIQVPFRGPEG